MNTPKTLRRLALAVVMLVAASCSAAAARAGTLRDPFTARTESGDGNVVELKGYTRGYRAGGQASFDLMLRNDSTDVWQSRYCLALVDRSGPIATFAADSFALQPNSADALTFDTRLPESLADGCYGLALVVPGRGVTVTTITVGDGDGPCTGPWSAPECP